MKARFLALAALVLGLASCQTEPEGLNVNVGGEQETYVTVSLPETTRAADSADGAFKNLVNSNEYTIRYIFQVFYKDTESKAARQVIYSDGNTVSFPVRLVPGRDYNFVAWADVVPEADKTLDVLGVYNAASDYRYNTEHLDAVTFKGDWLAMDETFDAYTDAQTIEYYGTTSINLNLTRPFAKLRVLTTDMVELGNLQIVPEGVNVTYTVPVYKSFDVTAQAANTTGASTHTFTYNLSKVQKYTATETTSTLFTNYLFGAENGVVKFTMDVNDNTSVAELIKSNNFNTDIPVQRNYLTTISGNILTDGNNIKVDIVEDGAFEGEKEWPEEGDSAQELAYAAMFGGEVTLIEDITLTQPLTIVDGANVVINLDGKTITGASIKGEGAIIENNGILTLVGGTIKNTETNGDAVINNNGELVLDGVKIEGAPLGDGGYSAYAVISSGKMTINDGTNVYADRGCLKLSNGGETFINGGLFVNNDIGTRSLTSHVVDVEDGGNNNLTINGGTFEHRHTNTSGGVVICNRTKGTVYINGGKFSGGKYVSGQHNLSDYGYGGKFSVKGGIFSDNISSKYIATGYKAVKISDGKYIVVTEEIDNVVDSTESAQNALDYADADAIIQLQPGDYGTLFIRPVAGASNTITNCDYLVYKNEMLRKVENLTIVGAPGVKVDGIKVVAGYVENSGSTGYVVDIKNLVIDSVEFSDEYVMSSKHSYSAPVFIDLSYINVDGLTVKNCKLEGSNSKMNLVYTYGSGNPSNSTFETAAKNIVIENNTVDGIARLCELRQTENVTITNNTIKNTALHGILLPVDDGTYSGKVTITDNYAEGINERFVRMAGAGNAEVVIKNNTIANYKGADADYIKVTDGTNVTIENNQFIKTVTTAADLATIINNATTDVTVKFDADLEGNITLNQKAGKHFTIDGNGKNYKGGIHIYGNGGMNDRWMTIKNINFDGTGLNSDQGCIYTTGAANGVNSYACNVTIENCTFTGAGVAAIRQNVAGERNWTIKNCTVASDMHSFLQVSNTNESLIVENCKVYSKNGANLNYTAKASFTGCEFDVQGYAVRVGVNGSNSTETKVFNFTDCNLKSANDDGDAVVIIRQDAQQATLNFVNTTLVGNPQISGNVDGKTTINGLQ